MRTGFISSRAITEAVRLSVMKTQKQLSEAHQEVTTGRLADLGISLGYKAGQSVSLRQEQARLETIKDSNAIVSTRLEGSQSALKDIVSTAQSFVSSLLAVRSSAGDPETAKTVATTALQSMTSALNSQVAGTYLFAGINSDVLPVADYYGNPTSTARTNVGTAFSTAFGMPASSSTVNTLSASDVTTFLSGAFDGLFSDTSWKTSWSAASDQNVRSRVSSSELIDTSVSANLEPFRKLTSAFTMIADLGIENMSENARNALLDKAVGVAEQSIGQISIIQSTLGNAQERVSSANDRMTIQANILSTSINDLESVDPYEASTRVTQMQTQLETAYALTARLQKLSLLNYL